VAIAINTNMALYALVGDAPENGTAKSRKLVPTQRFDRQR
jgi:hypothetical protein